MRLLVLIAALLPLVLPAVAFGGATPKPLVPPAKPAGPPLAGDTPSYADRVKIHWRVTGQGAKTLVLIHCWAGDSTMWDGVLPQLAATHKVVTLDLAGHGQSGRDRKDWTIESFAADVKTVVEAARLGKVVLVGHSLGGPVALAAAAIMPEHVVGVVGVDSLHDVELKGNPEQRRRWVAAFERDFPAHAEMYVRSLFGDAADPGVVEATAKKMAAATPAMAVAVLRASLTFDTGSAMTRAKVPVRCVNGDKTPTNVDGNRGYNANYAVKILKGVGHFPQLEEPAQFLAALKETIDSM